MIYTIEDLLAMIKAQAEHKDGVYLLPENVETLATYLDTIKRVGAMDVEKLVGRIAWLETSIKRSHAKAAQLTQELDAACPHS